MFNEKTEDEWLRELVKGTYVPDYDRFKKEAVYRPGFSEPRVAFKEEIEDPKGHPFPTPSGKIEIYSQRLADMNDPAIPAIPEYIETWENRNDPLKAKYPLQLITTHFKRRTHSQFEQVPWLKELLPQALSIHPTDVIVRGIRDGDEVRVFNDRGDLVIPAKVTERILPGVVDLPQGAWYSPDESGIDRGGCANVLTRDIHSPGGASCFNTCLVQVERNSKTLANRSKDHDARPREQCGTVLQRANVLQNRQGDGMSQLGFHFDQSRCSGCLTCMVACKDWHDIGSGPVFRMHITTAEQGQFPNVSVSFLLKSCYHCGSPPCVPACPAGAITKQKENGIVVVDREVCLGLANCGGPCRTACPYGAPQFGPELEAKMEKCDLCLERWTEDKRPICVEACPMRALDAGLLAELESKHRNRGPAAEAIGFTSDGVIKPSITFKTKGRFPSP